MATPMHRAYDGVRRIGIPVATVIGLIASVAQIAQVFRDGDYSLLAICLIGLCDAALVVFLVIIIRDRRAAQKTGGPSFGVLPIVAISGILALTAAGLVVSLGYSAGPGQTTTTNPPAVPPVNPVSSQSPGQTNCVAQDGAKAACDTASSYFVTKVSPCTADAALRQFGIDPEEQQLDLEAQSAAGACLLRPGTLARAEGATAHNVMRLTAGAVDSQFRLCLTTDSGPVVACTQPHFTELVSSSKSADVLSDVDSCMQPARRYTGRTLDDPFGELQPVLLKSPSDQGSTYQCGVRSTQKLDDTIWHLGTAPVPLAK
jgi:hypothetical protein